ncbi:MAG: peptidoglycan-binding protein [Zoogloea sp.]|nr:peptidoglycan-binding protein [Zoogloea sp.]
MHQSVRNTFVPFSTQFEGSVDFMYLDINGNVTTAIGYLLPSLQSAQQIPFFFKDDRNHAATADDIADDWNRVTARQDLRSLGGLAYRDVAQLRISQDTIISLTLSRAASFEQTLKQTPNFGDFDNWPADAQLGLMSMAWAMGPDFGPGWPNFRAACANKDFDAAAENSHINDDDNPGLRPRNQANVILFTNAARVRDGIVDADITVLHWPQILTPGVQPVTPPGGGVSDVPLLQSGSMGEQVKALQLLLAEAGFIVPVTSGFDTDTDAAVRGFQAATSLTADGKVGANTWGKLFVTRRQGDTGSAVSAIQSMLSMWDIDLTFANDGTFDDNTFNAVVSFQQQHNLGTDGIVGLTTWKALLKAV